jgi:hypothetical protein
MAEDWVTIAIGIGSFFAGIILGICWSDCCFPVQNRARVAPAPPAQTPTKTTTTTTTIATTITPPLPQYEGRRRMPDACVTVLELISVIIVQMLHLDTFYPITARKYCRSFDVIVPALREFRDLLLVEDDIDDAEEKWSPISPHAMLANDLQSLTIYMRNMCGKSCETSHSEDELPTIRSMTTLLIRARKGFGHDFVALTPVLRGITPDNALDDEFMRTHRPQALKSATIDGSVVVTARNR